MNLISGSRSCSRVSFHRIVGALALLLAATNTDFRNFADAWHRDEVL
jgi:hypothetical protein